MIINKEDIFKLVKDISKSTRFAVLATDTNSKPYTSLVGYMIDDDLKSLYFFTSGKSEKFKNILSNASVSLLIDNRDFYNQNPELVTAITVIGNASAQPEPQDSFMQKYIERIPELSRLIKSDFKILIRVNVLKYIIVNEFQQIIELKIQ